MTKPHTYPLFKGHKLSEEDFTNKIIPPTRMVTAAVGGPTYRLGVFINNILQPIADKYCEGELVRDTTHFLRDIRDLNQAGTFSEPDVLIGTLDVDALYPNIDQRLAMVAIEDALRTCTEYTEELIQTVLDLTMFCLQNSVVHHRGSWYRSMDGVPTGGPESGSAANIYVKWFLDKKLLVDPRISAKNKIDTRRRFLDDLWFPWVGTKLDFNSFLDTLNDIGKQDKFTLKGSVNTTVEFLDVRMTIENGAIKTSIYIKPTDAKRYLNRRSDHGGHMFKAIPFSQFRRALVICSDSQDQMKCASYMKKKFMDSGYSKEELRAPMKKALVLDRDLILDNCLIKSKENGDKVEVLTFVLNHDPDMVAHIKDFLKRNDLLLKRLIGNRRVIISERKSPNTAALLFAKSSFSKSISSMNDSQKCGAQGCYTCKELGIPRSIIVNNLKIKLDYTLNCKSENIIYIAICRHCENLSSFYFGQTVTPAHIRFNSHRGCFKFGNFKYKESALSFHCYDVHLGHFENKLKNYKLGIVKQISPRNLNRLENYYIYNTEAEKFL